MERLIENFPSILHLSLEMIIVITMINDTVKKKLRERKKLYIYGREFLVTKCM
jgi:hypothetical protein